MATQTTHLGLTNQAGTDKNHRPVINGNNDIVDSWATGVDTHLANIDANMAFVAVQSGNNWQLPSGKSAASGEYIVVDGILGHATAAITGGSTNIVSGTNWTPETKGGLNALNDNIGDLKGSYNVGSNTLANIQDAIYALVGDMQNGEQKNITFAISTAASPFSVSTYIGDLLRISRTRFRVEVGDAAYGTSEIFGRYKDGTWYWAIANVDKNPKYAIKTVEAGSGTTAMKTVTTSINKSTLLSELSATDILTIIPVGGYWTGGDGTSYAVIKQVETSSTGWTIRWGGNVTGVVMLLTYIVVYY